MTRPEIGVLEQYPDLEIELSRAGAEEYGVQLRFVFPGSDGDVKPAKSILPLSAFAADRFRALSLDLDTYSAVLTTSLFADETLRLTFARASTIALELELPLRVRLYIASSAPELHTLAWELLCDPDDNSLLCTNDRFLFTRSLSSSDWRPIKLRSKGEIKALVLVADPLNLAEYGLPEIDSETQLRHIREYLVDVPVTTLVGSEANLTTLASRMSEGFDLIYLVAHGALIEGEPILYLESQDRTVAVTSGSELATALRELIVCPRLVVLLSCMSSGDGNGEVLNALGPRIVEAGVPAVIGMQGLFSIATAARMMPRFFKELAAHGQIDRALAIARRTVRERDDSWRPVLFSRLKSGRIWYLPGFAGKPDKLGGYQRWRALINNIKQQRCTPILGSDLLEPYLGSTREIAQRWSETYHFPLQPHEREDLPQVAQYLAVNQDEQFPRDMLAEYLRNEIVRRFGERLPDALRDARPGTLDQLIEAAGAIRRAEDYFDPHRVLADLPFPIYITTNPDNLLEAALSAAGKVPKAAICPWNDYVERLQVEEATQDVDYEPLTEQPFVYHLFGRLREPESVVLTEDDYFKYLIGVTRHNRLLPEVVRDAISDTLLLFLGFQLDDWNFRVLFHSFFSREGTFRLSRYHHVAVQINPDENRILEPERARQYLEMYFRDAAAIDIYWGSATDFIRDLQEQLTKQVTL